MARIVTCGVYGFTDETFFLALADARINVFVDTRRRRAVRGATYAFANSRRLQERLGQLDIPYQHRLDLAPSETTRRAQDAVDRAAHIRRRDRTELSPAFRLQYAEECLANLDSREFVTSLGPNRQSILIFCVEREPGACHRSLLADKLASDLGVDVEHIVP